MLVICDTNVLVQYVERRDDPALVASTDQIFQAFVANQIELCFPAFSILEADFVLRSAARRRERLANDLLNEERELRRSAESRDAAGKLSDFRAELIAIKGRQVRSLSSITDTIVQRGGAVALDQPVLQEALVIARSALLDFADAVVFSSALRRLESGTQYDSAVFLTLNRNDFDKVEIHERLRTLRCDLQFHPAQTVATIRKDIASDS